MEAKIIEVIILEDGLHAKEVNHVTNPTMGNRHINYEKMLRTFEINNKVIGSMFGLLIEREGKTGNEGAYISNPGFKHTGKILTNGKIQII